MQAEKATPKEVVRIMGKKYGLTESGARFLIDFHNAKVQKENRVHGAERRFAQLREELGEYFPDPNKRVDVLDDFERMFI